jgi:glycosyltransferase involved in cell wall biosynthesis
MKVLVFTTVFPNPALPVRGLFVYERVRHAARHAEVRVVAPVPWFHRRGRAGSPSRETRGGLTVEHPTFYYVPFVGKYLDGLFLFLSALACVARLRREFDFDLIDGHFGYPDGFAAVLLGWFFRRPVTLTLRGSETEHLAHPLKRWAMRWAWRRATRVMAVSHQLGKMAEDLGVTPDRVRVIPNGVDGNRYCPGDRDESRRKLGLPLSGRLLVSVGHLTARKGFHRVVRVLPQLLRDFPDLTFAVVGGMEAAGTYETSLRRTIAGLGLGDKARLAGPLPPEEVVRWLRAGDLFVLASAREGCPNAVWEAMACGCPVVATRVGEVDRMVPESAGILYDGVEDDGELLRCLRDGLRRSWDTARIRAHVEQYTWDRVAAAVLEEWRVAVAERPLAPAIREEAPASEFSVPGSSSAS